MNFRAIFQKKRYVSAVIIAVSLSLFLSDNVNAENVVRGEKLHIVVPGDNLVKISDRYGVSIGALALTNDLTGTKIFVGQQLVIPDYDAPVNPTSADRDLYATITYVVRPGDTLGAIAQNYGSTVEKIAAASELLSSSILVDQFLAIPPELSLDVPNEIQESHADVELEEIDSDSISEDTDSNSTIVTTVVNGVSQDEERQRQELYGAGYEYAFSASAEDIERIYKYTVNGGNENAVDVVTNYWNYVNQGNYESAWQLLSTGFRERVHEGNFQSYVQGYHEMNLCSVSSEDVDNVTETILKAVITTNITYRTGPDCTLFQFDMRLTLRDRALVGVWDIDSVDVSLEEQDNILGMDGVEDERGWIDIDISEQRVYAMQGEDQIREIVVSTGIDRYPTVTGQFQIYVKHLKADMRGVDLGVPWYLPDVPYVMYFFSGYGIHGTYWHDNFGTPMSHGCINLTIPDAEWLYKFSKVGTRVNIHY
jgi:LysM repeat protein